VTRVRLAVGGALVVVAASMVAWSLAYPQASLSATSVRALTDCAAVVTLGLAAVPWLDDARHRAELAASRAAPLAVAAAVWLIAELTRLVVATAATAAVPLTRLGSGTAVDYAVATAPGRAGLVGVVAAAGCAAASLASRRPPVGVVVAGLAAAGTVARTLTGHFAESAAAGLAVAAHTLAAAAWCGVLAALVLTVEHRGRWARVLPRFSQLSLGCVAVLLAGGVVGAGSRLADAGQLVSTGYGRVLAAKVVITAVLVTLGWRNRTMWLPAARTHRATAVLSRTRAIVELAVMAVALALAAGLAVTGSAS